MVHTASYAPVRPQEVSDPCPDLPILLANGILTSFASRVGGAPAGLMWWWGGYPCLGDTD
jgi:hypothetical protein